MTSARRNLVIILVFLAMIVAALLVIIPGSPISEPTRLGLDLKGGVELVYEGRPTPKQPEVTPQSIDDALETIRKRTDALGVSEPEIQRAGASPPPPPGSISVWSAPREPRACSERAPHQGA